MKKLIQKLQQLFDNSTKKTEKEAIRKRLIKLKLKNDTKR